MPSSVLNRIRMWGTSHGNASFGRIVIGFTDKGTLNGWGMCRGAKVDKGLGRRVDSCVGSDMSRVDQRRSSLDDTFTGGARGFTTVGVVAGGDPKIRGDLETDGVDR